jgi:hypothetical protein
MQPCRTSKLAKSYRLNHRPHFMASSSPHSSAWQGLDLRPLTTSELVDRGFQLYRRHFSGLLLFGALVHCLPFLFGVILTVWGERLDFQALMTNPGPAMPLLTTVGLAGLVSFFIFAAGNGVLTVYIADLYLGRPASISASLAAFPRRAWACFSTAILKTLILVVVFALSMVPLAVGLHFQAWREPWTALGALFLSLLLLGPGLVLTVRWLLTPQIVMLEDLAAAAALRRASQMTRYDPGLGIMYWGETRLSLVLLILVVAGALVAMMSSLPMVIWQIHSVFSGQHSGAHLPAPAPIMLTTHLLDFIGSSIVTPLYVTAATLFYFDIRIRREGFDLEVLAQDLEPDAKPPLHPGEP